MTDEIGFYIMFNTWFYLSEIEYDWLIHTYDDDILLVKSVDWLFLCYRWWLSSWFMYFFGMMIFYFILYNELVMNL